MTTRMRTGLGWMAAMALAFAGAAGSAQVPAPVAQPTVAAAPQAAAAPGAVSNIAPTSVEAAPPANPASPVLAVDGATGLTPVAGIGQPVDGRIGLQPQVTKNGEFAAWMHDTILLWTISIICLFVLLLIAYVVFRFRRSANPVPSKTSHNTVIEVIWTLAPVVILVLIAVPSIGLLQAQFKPAPAGAVTLKAIGNQWYWTYQYPDHGTFEVTANMLKEADQVGKGERFRTDRDGPRLLAVDNRIVLPVGMPIRLITTANDVIHSWGVPAFWAKLDAVPGRLNEMSFTIEKPGLYFGQCSELCGSRHAYMPIAVEAVSPAQFAAWIRAKGGTMPTPGQPSGAVIPQPGAAGSAAAAEEATTTNAMAGPTENVTTTAPATTQGATRNSDGAAQTGL